jgi:phosphoribosylformimino-5-aminoimidazole carboxamide ribotide isomerase
MIIPVLDIKNEKAVSGKSGKRETYKPLKTIYHNSSSPIKIANALKIAGASRIYIADLDSIEGIGSNFNIIKQINEHHIPVMLDCGVENLDDVANALKIADKVIVATETIKNIEELSRIFNSFSKDRLIISIDIKNGKLFSKHLNIDLEKLTTIIKNLNPKEIIVLDISRIGLEKGVDKGLIKKFRGIEESLIIGGGIRYNDIIQLEKCGIKKFLVGSTLHNGNLKLNK